jgi:hypothetical protein
VLKKFNTRTVRILIYSMDIKDSDLKDLFKLCGSFDWSSKMRADPEVRFSDLHDL